MKQDAAQSDPVITLFVCGDIMTGRGIDQILPHPSNPRIHEPYVQNAQRYIDIAEQKNGPIPRQVPFSYIWGDALEAFAKMAPDVRIINLETSVTQSDDYWRGKSINYRMHPKNIPCITAAAIDCCVLANNHVLDWGYQGLEETLKTLHNVKLNTAGAGQNLAAANAPAVLPVPDKGNVIVFSYGLESSGVPWQWAAHADKPGINLLPNLSSNTVAEIAAAIRNVKQPGDTVVASIHWGSNWGYAIPSEQIQFAHQLVDSAGVDIIHGHSSHHSLGIEVYHHKPIIYGCGDFLNDYEGIGGYENFRAELALMYFIHMAPRSGKLIEIEMIPMQIKHFKSNRVSQVDAIWLRDTLNKASQQFNTTIILNKDNHLIIQ